MFMIHTFKSRKEIVIEAHDKGISIIVPDLDDTNSDQYTHFEWDRIPVLIEVLQLMLTDWNESR